MKRINKLVLVGFCALTLAACSAPANRADNPELFKQVASGRVSQEKIPEFVDCLIDGFTRAKSQGNSDRVWQQQRSFGWRIEIYVGPHLMLSADIQRDGNTMLLEGHAALFVSQSKEIAEYKACVSQHV